MNDVVYLNGRYIDHAEAKIPADDRGFHFADGVYEVVKYYSGNPFRFDDHEKRLGNSLAGINIHFEGISGFREIFDKLISVNNLGNEQAGVYLQISRGAHKRVHHFPLIDHPTVYACAFPFPSSAANLENGISIITAEDIRWLRCDIKSVCLLPNSMLFQKAVENGAGECVLIRNGLVTEATHSSVAGIRNGKLLTHPLNNLILPGITRKVTLEICEKHGIPVLEEAITADELCLLDELIICGTGSEITPAVTADGRPVGNGKPGPVTRFLQEKFFEMTGN